MESTQGDLARRPKAQVQNCLITNEPLDCFQILHHNIRSIRNKQLEVSVLLEDEQPDVVAFTEFGLSKEEAEILHIQNYVLMDCFARIHKKAGGAALYCKTVLDCSPLDLSFFQKEMDFEVTGCIVDRKNDKFAVICLYRSPNGNMDTFLNTLPQLMSFASNRCKNVAICGDINIDVLSRSQDQRNYTDILSSQGFRNLVNVPTRVTNHSETAIDHVLVNFDNCLVEVVKSAISDHTYQNCIVSSPVKVPVVEEAVFTRRLNNSNRRQFASAISSQTWQIVYDSASLSCKFSAFMQLLLYQFELNFPKVPQRNFLKPQKTWVTKEVIDARNKLNYLDNLCKSSDSPQLRQRLKDYRHVYKNILNRNKELDLQKTIKKSKNVSKGTWQAVNANLGRDSSSKPLSSLATIDGALSDPEAIAEYLCKQFLLLPDVTSFKDKRIPSVNLSSIFLSPVTAREVEKMINSRPNKNSAGPDELPWSLLKNCSSDLSEPLAHLINKSFDEGVFPECLKVAKVVPILKGGDPKVAANYRPISLLPSVSKVFELAMARRLVDFLETRNLLTERQFGFRRGKSTTGAVMEIIREVHTAMENHSYSLGVFMDLSKAFDCVDHNRLLRKLESVGIRGTANDWFRSYLQGRTQYVSVNGSSSKKVLVQRGVPQGSILGPILFLIYINDFPDSVLASLNIVFADDCAVMLRGRSVGDLEMGAFIGISTAVQWFEDNRLSLNAKKTNYVIFQNRGKQAVDPVVQVGELDVDRVSSCKYLGLILDEGLTWDDHIEYLCGRLSKVNFAISCASRYCKQDTLCIIYHGLFVSVARYGIICWGSTSNENMARLMLIQKRVIRSMAKLGNRESCKDIFRTWKLLTIPAIFILESITYTLGSDNFARLADISTYQTRTNDMAIPLFRLSSSRRSILCCGARFFNALPAELKAIESPKCLKSRLKEHLLDLAPYTIEEFVQSS